MRNKDQKIQDSSAFEIGTEPISQLLGALRRVEAPSDFDFRLRARIAGRRPAERTTSWLSASVRYAVPLGLLLIVGGYFGFNAIYSPSEFQVPVVVEVPTENIAPIRDAGSRETAPADSRVAEVADIKPAETKDKRVDRTPGRIIAPPNPKSDRSGGGSYDAAVKKSINLSAPGVDGNSNLSQNPVTSTNSVQPSVKDFLGSVGINASVAGPGGRVRSVSGAAAGAGVKAGDVIEAVNVQGASIRVRRDGKSMAIGVKP